MTDRPADTDTDTEPAALEPAWTVDRLVEALFAARRDGTAIAAERIARVVTSADIAYRVQARIDARLSPDRPAAAWKAGADSRDSLPTAAPIVPSLVHASGASLVATHPVCIVEAEIAYRFGVDMPPRAAPYTTDEVADAVAGIVVAIEVVSPRIADFTNASPLVKLADHLVNGALIVGDGTTAWRRIDLRRQKATLSIDGRVQQAVTGSHALGNPAVLLPWFVAHLGRLATLEADGAGPPRGVKAGDVVTTGSWTKVVEARAGQRVDVSFDAVGSASVRFA